MSDEYYSDEYQSDSSFSSNDEKRTKNKANYSLIAKNIDEIHSRKYVKCIGKLSPMIIKYNKMPLYLYFYNTIIKDKTYKSNNELIMKMAFCECFDKEESLKLLIRLILFIIETNGVFRKTLLDTGTKILEIKIDDRFLGYPDNYYPKILMLVRNYWRTNNRSNDKTINVIYHHLTNIK
jgi:hypothetical protein